MELVYALTAGLVAIIIGLLLRKPAQNFVRYFVSLPTPVQNRAVFIEAVVLVIIILVLRNI